MTKWKKCPKCLGFIPEDWEYHKLCGWKLKYYSREFRELREELLEQANYQCTECGCPSLLEDYFSLEIHHVDGNISNNDLGNLSVLCHSCHLKAQSELR